MREQILINQGAITVEVHTQLINDLSNSEREKDIINHPLIHTTLIISVMNVTIINQIRYSGVDRRIISLKIFQNRTLLIINFTGSRKS